jgi:antitoxin component of MazEF toxin-antitoxin module
VATLKFVGRISTQGNNLIVWIPKEFHKDVKQLKGKQVRVIIDDEI